MDWNDFAKRLTIELMWLPERSFLIVQRTGGLPYVQAMRSRETLEAEAVGSAFLPEPLAPQQERRLTVNGWERPADPGRDNWWSRVPMTERSGRPARDRAEGCAALALRMVAAFRDAYDVPSPLDLVYQAGDSETGETLELNGLGIPRSVPETSETERRDVPPGPLTDTALEDALAAARQRGDQDAYLELLARAVLYLPSPADLTYDDGTGHQYATARFGDETFVLAFTSPEAMDRSLRGQAVHHREALLPDLTKNWPNPEWQLAVNPGLPSAAYLEASSLPSAQEPMRIKVPAPRPAVDPVWETAPVDGPVSAPSSTEPGLQDAVMQKVIRPEHVVHYLEGSYALVSGYVHLLRDVRDLDTPAKLIRRLGLVYKGAPFHVSDEAIHVIRWPAHKPVLLRRPLGGIDEWSMGAVPGGWVIENAPFTGSGYAPGDGPEITEFKIDSQRLPHGAEMYRIEGSGQETLIGGYDADLRRWLLVPGVTPPGGMGRAEKRPEGVQDGGRG